MAEQLMKTEHCLNIPTALWLNLANYILWIFLFFGSIYWATASKVKELQVFYVMAIVNLLFKVLAALALSMTEDLLGTCFLNAHFHKWVWILSVFEVILFSFIVYRIKNYQNKLTSQGVCE